MGFVRVIAHRGYSEAYAENTLKAFEEAAKVGADAVETDLQVTKDGVVVLNHDHCIASVPTCELEYRQAKELKPDLATLVELLEAFKNWEMEFNLEVKDRRVVSPLVRILLERPECADRSIVSSFDGILLKEFKELFPRVRTSLLLGTVLEADDMVAMAKNYGCDFVHPCWESRGYYPHELLPLRTVEEIKKNGLEVIVWHEERPEELLCLLELPVYGVCTNDPALLVQLRSGRGVGRGSGRKV